MYVTAAVVVSVVMRLSFRGAVASEAAFVWQLTQVPGS
jgi:hypothetical protein